MKKILKYAFKVGISVAVISSIGRCNPGDVFERSKGMLQDNNPYVYNTLDKIIGAGENVYESIKDRINVRDVKDIYDVLFE